MPPKTSADKYISNAGEYSSELLLGDEIDSSQEQKDEELETSETSTSIPNKTFKQQI